MVRRVVDLVTDHGDVVGDTLFTAVPDLSDDERVGHTTFQRVPVFNGFPVDTLIVEPLTHTARWGTVEVEPVHAILDQTERRQNVTQGLFRHHLTATPVTAATQEWSDVRLDFAIVAAEVLDQHGNLLALSAQAHNRVSVVGPQVTYDIEATYTLVTLRHFGLPPCMPEPWPRHRC